MRSSKIALRHGATVTLIVAALLAAGCSSMSEREQGTAKGAGAGAVAGAIIGSVTGGSAGRGAVIGGAVGAVAGNLWSKRMEDKRAALAQASQGTGVEVARTADNRLKLNVPSDVSFDTGRADIKPQMRPVLDEIGRNLDPGVHVTVVGHTDSTGSDAINEPLSRERAAAVRDYLSARGVSSSRVAVAGRGSHEPVASNDTEAGRAANRRVEIFLAEQG
ncbi:OmpA family protein [Pelomonas sp. Root1217]|uniref:OmpA family protein n=1 Tax=Pelomonas sp. Root1217 TaxID=1736430 RepID=UPI0009E85A7A|nr:OmpA family protein [Pelomonas sp. Root1217]